MTSEPLATPVGATGRRGRGGEAEADQGVAGRDGLPQCVVLTVDAAVRSGHSVVSGTRVPYELVTDLVADGVPLEPTDRHESHVNAVRSTCRVTAGGAKRVRRGWCRRRGLGYAFVDAADLDYQARTLSGCIPPHMVSRLLEFGHAEKVESQAGRGEWFCVREWARLLGERGRQAEALEVLAPYVATGWWKAAETTAELLEEWERIEEAIALARPYAEAGDRPALRFFARLLARHGRGDEAFTLLRPHLGDWFLAEALVDVAEGAGRDEDECQRSGHGRAR